MSSLTAYALPETHGALRHVSSGMPLPDRGARPLQAPQDRAPVGAARVPPACLPHLL